MSSSGRSREEWLVVDGGAGLAEAEWQARSDAVALGLRARGVGVGTPVGLLFDPRCWAGFAVAHAGVGKAGAVTVLVSPGAPPAARGRTLAEAAVAGLLHAAHLHAPAGPWWSATLDEIECGPAEAAGGPDVADPAADGWLVHAWAPGTPAGEYAMRLLTAGQRSATLAVFDARRFCALVEQRRALMCGLTPALAAAVVATCAGRVHDPSSVTRVVLSGPASAGVRDGLQAVFPRAEITGIDLRSPGSSVAAGAPVAVSQEPMLWHEQFTPGSFNLPCLVRRYQGPLDVAALEAALAELVRRHQPLRSTFVVAGEEPLQVLGDASAFALPLVDLSRLEAGARDAEAARLLADATSRPFDLASGPLFGPRLVRLGPGDHLLVVRLHHTVFDDWSVDVLRRELSALYAARLAGAPSPLVEPATGFVDFCRRQRATLTGERGAAQREWWRRELAGAPIAVQLPIGDGAMTQPAGEPLRVDLPAPLAAALRALAPRLRATPFMTVLAAFSVLLSRVTGRDDLVIATVVAHRDDSDVEPLIGCFTKKVPLRLRLAGDPTFADLVARTRSSLLGALAHQDLAFDAAVQIGLGDAAADHGVVPQVAVVFQAEAPQRVKLAMPGLTIGPYEVRAEARRERRFSWGPETGAGEADAPVWGDGIYLGTFLILSLMDTAGGLAFVARGVFDRPAGRRLLEDFETLLADAVADPGQPIFKLRGGAPAPAAADSDELDLLGFRARRSRIERGLAQCPGVTDVAVAVRNGRLVAYVVVDGPPPTLTELRNALWAVLPGAPWPAEAVVVDALPRRPDGSLDLAALPPGATVCAGMDPEAVALTAMWAEIAGRPVVPTDNYWQDFTFLRVLAEAREAGLELTDRRVVRCRTPEMLAASRPSPAP